MTSAPLAPDTMVVATDAQVSSSLEDEEVILHLESGTYYGLNPVGRHIWRLVQSPTTVQSICDRIEADFDVGRKQVERDVVSLLEDLIAEDLVYVTSE